MSSPLRSLYSLKTFSRSASRTRCRMTCLAVWAAMRPKPFQARLSFSSSPYLASCSSALAWSFSSIEDLEQQLVADLGLEADALRVGDAGSRLPSLPAVTASTMTMIWNRSTAPALLVELGLDLALHAERALGGGQDRLLERLTSTGVDPLVLGDLSRTIVRFGCMCYPSLPGLRTKLDLEIGLFHFVDRDRDTPAHPTSIRTLALLHRHQPPAKFRRFTALGTLVRILAFLPRSDGSPPPS